MTKQDQPAARPAWTAHRTAAVVLIGVLWALSAAGWDLDVDVVTRHDLPLELHGLVGTAVAVVTVAATVASAAAVIIVKCSKPRLKPGERIVSAETYAADQRFYMEMLALTYGQDRDRQDGTPPRGLRAV